MKTLLIGPAGSGKTHFLLDEFEASLRGSKNPLEDSFYFVLPSAEHTERVISLTLQRGIKGFFGARVTTLSSLIHQTFGVGESGVATNVTRYLMLRRLFEDQPWEYFQEVQHTPGFLNLLLGFITELKESRISSDVFRARINALKTLEPELAPKHEALAGIFEAYERRLSEKGLRDRQDGFDIYLKQKEMRKQKPGKRFQKIWMDGFFDFSELQLAYLSELAGQTENMVITLTVDPEPRREHLFEALAKTQKKLKALGFEIQSMPRRSSSGTLAHIEKHLFSSETLKTKPASDSQITIFESIGMEGEVEMIARTILHMMKRGTHRLSDFAVLFRMIGDYESMIRSVFAKYGLPVEIHERERLGLSPISGVIVSLLRIFLGGWQRSDLMDFLKSNYVATLDGSPKDYEWVSRLEHESMRKRIYAGKEAWLELDESQGLSELEALETGLRNAQHYGSFKALFLNAVKRLLNVPESLRLSAGAKRDGVCLRRFESILDEISHSFPEKGSIDFEAFCERFFRLVDIDLYSLREKDKNRVQVYDISLARQKEYRVVFVAGLLEKKFPIQMKEDPVLSDWERQLFNGDHTEGILQERLSRQTMERYLFYLAVTRAKEKLILTYPHLDLEGNASLASYYVDEVRRLFEGKVNEKRQDLSRPYPEIQDAVNKRELEAAVIGALCNPVLGDADREPFTLYVTNQMLETDETQNRIKRAFYKPVDQLEDSKIGKEDPFRSKMTSPSKLEAYGKCPFSYFAEHVLHLGDPDADPNVKQRGNILHKVLELCFEIWAKDPGLRCDISAAKEMAQEKLNEVLKDIPIVSDRRYRYDLEISDLRETLDRFLDKELGELMHSPFQPKHFEYGFGVKGAETPPLKLKFEDRVVEIRGVIDRIDVSEDQKKAMVLDYKRNVEFKKDKLELGTALQLPIYLLAAQEAFPYEVLGAELYSLKDRRRNGFYREAYLDYFKKKRNQILLGEAELEKLLNRSLDYIHKYSQGMENVEMRAHPKDKDHCEKFCPYGEVCRIQKWRVPLLIDELKKKTAEAGAAPMQHV